MAFSAFFLHRLTSARNMKTMAEDEGKISESALAGKLLIAMPGLTGQPFSNAVVYICVHSSDGAMGLIINKPSATLQFTDLLEQMDIKSDAGLSQRPVYFGGPVENGRGFVLHENCFDSSVSTMKLNDGFAITTTYDILEEMASGGGPANALVALGYAGWGPGQIESELARNSWLTVEADSALVFATSDEGKWKHALGKLGVEALALSAAGGRA